LIIVAHLFDQVKETSFPCAGFPETSREGPALRRRLTEHRGNGFAPSPRKVNESE